MTRSLRPVVCFALWIAVAAQSGAEQVRSAPDLSLESTIRVEDASGVPLAGAGVEAFAKPRVDTPYAALTHRVVVNETGENGGLPEPLPYLEDLLVVVDHPDYAPWVRAPWIRAGGMLPQRLRLSPGRDVRGRVTADAPPSPTAGRACAVWTTRNGEWRWSREWERCGEIDEDGHFHLRGLPKAPVQVQVHVQAPGFLPASAPLPVATKERDFVLTLERGTLVAGRVTTDSGEPIGGAAVTASEAEATTHLDGSFKIPVAHFPVDLLAEARGYRSRSLTLTKPPDEGPLVLALAPGQQLQGYLLSADGLTLQGGGLWVERQLAPGRWSGEKLEVEIGEGGEFLVDLPQSGRYRLALSAVGHRPHRLPETVLDPGQVWEVGTVVLERGGVITGSVIDAATGLPLRGASLRLLPVGPAFVQALRRGSLHRTTSQKDGSFELAGIEAGRYELQVEHRDHAPLLDEVLVSHDERTDLGELALGPGVRLFGRVVDRDGEGRVGMQVEISSPSGQAVQPFASTVTDAEGAFDDLTLLPGTYRLRVIGDRPLLSQALEVPEGVEEHELELVLTDVRLTGQLQQSGEPVSGGIVTVSSDLDPGWRRGKLIVRTAGELGSSRQASGLASTRLSAEVGPAGGFEISGVPAGPVTLTYYGVTGDRRTKRLQIPDRAEVHVTVELDGERLTGRVTDSETGNPITADLRLFDAAGRPVATAQAGEYGRFALDHLEPGNYRLEAESSGYRTASLEAVTPGEEPVRVELDRSGGGGLTVRLRRADGSPAAAVQVTVLSAAGHMLRSLLTDPYGVREFPGLSAGSYFVVWTDPLTGTGATGRVEVEEGPPTRLEKVLTNGSPVVLTCSADDCAGQPVNGLSLFTADGVEIGAYLPLVDPVLRFSLDGTLPLGRLATGRYLLRMWTAAGQQDRVVNVPPASGAVRVPL